MEKIKKIIPIILLFLIASLIFVYYSADYSYPPCCDTAITIMKAKQIASEGSLDVIQLYNPSSEVPIYTSAVSTESILHILLSVFYQADFSLSENLRFAKLFFLIIFILPIFSIYILSKEIFKDSFIPIILIVLLYFSFWYGSMYWLGHVAQMLGFFILPIFLYFLLKFHKDRKILFIISAIALLGFSFFVHVLTFLVMSIIFFTFIIYNELVIKNNNKLKLIVPGIYVLIAILFSLYLKFVPGQGKLLPNFEVNSSGHNIENITDTIYSLSVILVFFVIGGFVMIKNKFYLVLIWLISILLLTQTYLFETPFFADRFNEFFVLPFLFISFYGFKFIYDLIKDKKYKALLLAFMFVILLPIGIYQQQNYKKCYVQNCSGLHPVQMPTEDLIAFNWINENIEDKKIFTGIRKFGYYLPLVTDNPIEFPLNEKRELFTSSTSAERWNLAKKYNIDYIYWDAIFTQQNNQVKGVIGFTEEEFTDKQYFKKIYDNLGARIYEVQY